MIKNFNEKNNVNVVGADAIICPKKQKHTNNLIANTCLRKVNFDKQNLHPEAVTHYVRTASGITLIALVVTIIVLLILTSVALSLAMGDNGLLHRTETAVDEHDKKAATEKLNMIITTCKIEYFGEKGEMPGISYLAAYLEKNEEIDYVEKWSDETASIALLSDEEVNEYADWKGLKTKLKAYPRYEFEIDSDLELANVVVDGVQVASSTKTELENLKTENEDLKQRLDALENSMSNYLQKSEAQSMYATQDSLNSYITSTTADEKYALKTDASGSSSGYTITKLGEKTGTAELSINASLYDELYVEVKNAGSAENSDGYYIFNIKTHILESKAKVYFGDTVWSNSGYWCTIGASTSSVYIACCRRDNRDYTSSSTLVVYGIKY